MSKRKVFHETALERADQMARQLLDEVPELEGVVVNFVWRFDAPGIPTGVAWPAGSRWTLAGLGRAVDAALLGFADDRHPAHGGDSALGAKAFGQRPR